MALGLMQEMIAISNSRAQCALVLSQFSSVGF